MQSYVGGSSRLLQSVSARRFRSRCHAEGLPPLPALLDLSSVQPGALFSVSETVSSGAASSLTDSVDAITEAVNAAGVDAAAASSLPVEYLALGAVGVGAHVVTNTMSTK